MTPLAVKLSSYQETHLMRQSTLANKSSNMLQVQLFPQRLETSPLTSAGSLPSSRKEVFGVPQSVSPWHRKFTVAICLALGIRLRPRADFTSASKVCSR